MTTGIIAEYNPFHNGHKYQINKIKEKFNSFLFIKYGVDQTTTAIANP